MSFKGVILAGGRGSRLSPLTDITNKFLMPVYDKLMIEYSVLSLRDAGVTEIAIVLGTKSAGETMDYLKSGAKYGVKFTYFYQDEPLGVPHALMQVRGWAGFGDKLVVMCADNILYDSIDKYLEHFRVEMGSRGCLITTKRLNDIEQLKRFAILNFKDGKVISLVEKPEKPSSHLAFCGIQIYDDSIWNRMSRLKLSPRGEYEVTDLINDYINIGGLFGHLPLKKAWFDCGNKDALFEAQQYAYLHSISEVEQWEKHMKL